MGPVREPLLLPLARAYGVSLDDLVGAPRTGDPRVHLKPMANPVELLILFGQQGERAHVRARST